MDTNTQGETPPKDLANLIHRICFDYAPLGKEMRGKTVEERIFECWGGLHIILKDWATADPEGFLAYFKRP